MVDCDFCDEFCGGHHNAFDLRYGGSIPHRAVATGNNFRVFPSLGQLVEGHLLIVPFRHIRALGDLPNDEIAELESITQLVKSTLHALYGQCIFFEHGIRSEGSGGCGIDHAHMHAVPVRADNVLRVLRQEFHGRSIQSLADISSSLAKRSSYLFFEDASSKRYVFPTEKLPSQYMRKLVAASIGKTDWDWRECGHEPELLSTLQQLHQLFSAVAIANKD
jgi:diadenosine tetraphosphate (Ap4A) HIT family hydrolase